MPQTKSVQACIRNLRFKFFLHNFFFYIFSSFICCRYPDVWDCLNSSNSDNKVCSYYIVYHVPMTCLVSCKILKNMTIKWQSYLSFFLAVYNKHKKNISSCFLLSLYLCILFHAMFFFLVFLFTPTRFC